MGAAHWTEAGKSMEHSIRAKTDEVVMFDFNRRIVVTLDDQKKLHAAALTDDQIERLRWIWKNSVSRRP